MNWDVREGTKLALSFPAEVAQIQFGPEFMGLRLISPQSIRSVEGYCGNHEHLLRPGAMSGKHMQLSRPGEPRVGIPGEARQALPKAVNLNIDETEISWIWKWLILKRVFQEKPKSQYALGGLNSRKTARHLICHSLRSENPQTGWKCKGDHRYLWVFSPDSQVRTRAKRMLRYRHCLHGGSIQGIAPPLPHALSPPSAQRLQFFDKLKAEIILRALRRMIWSYSFVNTVPYEWRAA
jgi:hypothetical protein